MNRPTDAPRLARVVAPLGGVHGRWCRQWSFGSFVGGLTAFLGSVALAATPATVPAGTTPAAVLQPAAPLPPAPVELDSKLFPQPAALAPNVVFWSDIFAKYDGHQVLLHDDWYLDRVYAVLDFTELDADLSLSDVAKERRRKDTVRLELEKVRGHLSRLAAGQAPSQPEDAERFARLFGPGASRTDFRAAADRLRAQTGLKDQFERALVRSGRYLPWLEDAFRRRGIPTEIARLPFVESMFQENARSKVAAGGIWQIMPSTGRRFLRVAGDVDERFDPILAADAAAAVLRENYALLGTWPLAITAYNHGAGGLLRAVSKLGTTDMGVICQQHKGKLFGFASRNFYAEFLAAATLYANRGVEFPAVSPEPAWRFDVFQTQHYVPAQELSNRAQVGIDALRELNPAVDPEVWTGRMLLPAGYRLRVPEGQAAAFSNAYAALPANLKVERQAGTQYRVRSGDTLSGIARRFGTSVAALQSANRLGKRTTLRVGQVLQIPGSLTRLASRPAPSPAAPAPAKASATAASPGTTVVAETGEAAGAQALPSVASPTSAAIPQAVEAPAAATKAPLYHIVKRGDTLFSIARRYGVSVRALMVTNGLKTAHRIYPGQRLSIAR